MRLRVACAPGMSMPLGLTSKATFSMSCLNRMISIFLIARPLWRAPTSSVAAMSAVFSIVPSSDYSTTTWDFALRLMKSQS